MTRSALRTRRHVWAVGVFAITLGSPAQADQKEQQWVRSADICRALNEPLWPSDEHVHPLIGRVHPRPPVHVFDCALTDFGALKVGLNQQHPDVLLLGEVHDNAGHHRLRTHLLPATLSSGAASIGSVIMEQLSVDYQARLNSYGGVDVVAGGSRTITDFKSLIGWDQSGWSKYSYDPLLIAILQRRLPIYAGDVPRDAIMKAAREGEAGVPEPDRQRLALDMPLGAQLDAALADEIKGAHCGAMPDTAIPGMAFAQRYRDAHMADVALRAAEKHGSTIVLAGNGHVRSDRGVPWYIRQRAPGKKVISVMLVELEEGKTDPEAYIPRGADGTPAADYIVFTPRAERGDPCEAFRKKAN